MIKDYNVWAVTRRKKKIGAYSHEGSEILNVLDPTLSTEKWWTHHGPRAKFCVAFKKSEVDMGIPR